MNFLYAIHKHRTRISLIPLIYFKQTEGDVTSAKQKIVKEGIYNMKVVVVGCTHAGTSAVKSILANHPEAEVTVYERNDNISFLSCGIALYVGGVVKNAADLFYSNQKNWLL